MFSVDAIPQNTGHLCFPDRQLLNVNDESQTSWHVHGTFCRAKTKSNPKSGVITYRDLSSSCWGDAPSASS